MPAKAFELRWLRAVTSMSVLLIYPNVASAGSENNISFNRDVRPILSEHCYACHGPDENTRRADLRLDTEEGALADLDGKQAVVPGQPQESELFRRITAEKKRHLMPPPKFGKPLSAEQIDVLRSWIAGGAHWEGHWAFVAPKRHPLPKVDDESWVRNPIDNFVAARLQEEDLKPTAEAAPVLLARRAALDLTGLPPTPAEVDAFLADGSDVAYGKLVDRLLSSPRYGERLALDWLDAARFADTNGFHIDNQRDMWPWRDWVIKAFNENKPFDEFTVEQIAGDLLPDPTIAQQVATGFNRNHGINFEGGAIPEEYLTAYIVDRIATTSTVWLGLTLQCAQCHDHKFDPLTQKDFYSVYAFFNAVPEKGLDGRDGNSVPLVRLENDTHKRELKKWRDEVVSLKTQQEGRDTAAQGLFEEWKATETNRARSRAPEALDYLARYPLDEKSGESIAETTGNAPQAKIEGRARWRGGKVAGGFELGGRTSIVLGDVVGADGAGPFSISMWINRRNDDARIILSRRSDESDQRGYEVTHEGGNLTVVFRHKEGNEIHVSAKDALAKNEWLHLVVGYDGNGRAAGVSVHVSGQRLELEVANDSLRGPSRSTAPLRLGGGPSGDHFRGYIDDVRLYSRVLTDEEITRIAAYDPILDTLALDEGETTDEAKQQVRHHFLHHMDEPYKALVNELQAAEKKIADIDASIPTSMVMRQMDQPRDTFMLVRGEYHNRGEKVTAATPASLPPLPEAAPANRLGLARWIVDRSNPLTARVAVNRYWQSMFGTGIVKTVEDFGSQGEPPSHPKLLDWLAVEFIESGWDIKHLHRLILNSATYRQSSRVTPDLFERDPENRLLARGSRFRLPGEFIRDQALYVSGLLVETIGGPSVKPYQPAGLWKEVAYGAGMSRFSAGTYVEDTGDDLYRRSMYTFWKRSCPPPTLQTFDAPDREYCTVRRSRTNTPLQALALMNDPTFVEAARKFAEKIIKLGGDTVDSRVEFAVRTILVRTPTTPELEVLAELLNDQLSAFRDDPTAAAALLAVGQSERDESIDVVELAAWTALTNVLLNLDEVITKG